jgi:glycosyltransferase involved in cell wall biosynthesis
VRVLHVLPTRASEYGGPIRVTEAMCAQLVRLGHDAEILPGTDAPSPTATRFGYWPDVRTLGMLATRVRAADIVHVHGLWAVGPSMAAVYARMLGRPFVITPHGMLDHWSMRRSAGRKKLYAALIERTNLNAAAALHFFNAEEREEATAFGLRAPSFLLPNGVDLAQFADLPGRDVLASRYPQTRGKKVVLFLGRLHPKKGLPLLLQALPRLAPDVLLIIAGPDEIGHRAELEALITAECVQDRVLFTGPVGDADKRLLLGGADLFVLPSHQEGDSVAVKEALAAGLPVVITRACHFPEVERESAGLVINPGTEEVQRAIAQLCSDDALRARMAANARPLIDRSYRWDQLGERLVRNYEEVLARRRGPAVS